MLPSGQQQIRRTRDCGGLPTPTISIHIHTLPWAVHRRQLAFLEARACLPTEALALRLAQQVHETWNLWRSRFDEVRVTSHNRCFAPFVQHSCGHPDAPQVLRGHASFERPIRFQRVRTSAHPQPRVSVHWFHNTMCHVRGQRSRGYVHGPSEPRLCDIGVIARIKHLR